MSGESAAAGNILFEEKLLLKCQKFGRGAEESTNKIKANTSSSDNQT